MTPIKPPSGGPKCPNHGAPLEGMGFPMPKKGTGICPISGAPFEYEIETDEQKMKVEKDINGNIIKRAPWKLKGDEPK